MNFIKKNFSSVTVIGVGVVAIVLSLFLAGVIYDPEYSLTSTVTLISMMLGGGNMVLSAKNPNTGEKFVEKYNIVGGGSTFGLISFILVVLAILVALVAMVKKDKRFATLGGLLLIVGGALIFLLLATGNPIITSKLLGTSTSFADYFEGYRLGIGAIIYGIITIAGGLLAILSCESKPKKKKKRK